MRVAVVGGKLQGIETCYLARRAGWEVLLIDKDPSPPAKGLCDVFSHHNIVTQSKELTEVIGDVDLIIPAMENPEGLQSLDQTAARCRTPLAFDPEAYALTSSKKKSDALFHRLGLSAPRPWPDCSLPVIVKPVESSGSRGVRRIADRKAFRFFLEENPSELHHWILQEYLEGPSYSLEVVGLDGESVTLQTTGLEMDGTFDCKRVLAPVDLPSSLDKELREMASILAQALHLNGIMDVEVIHHEEHLSILEIDARFPSQTPTVVERSTGINLLELVKEIFLDSRLPEPPIIRSQRGVAYEHIRVSEDHLEVSGEHIMTEAGPLHMENDFFGADVALTSFSALDRPWVATLVVTGTDRERAWKKRCEVIRAIMEACKLTHYQDPVPGDAEA